MINKQLIHPESIVVIGGSNDLHKPGGTILRNLISGNFQGKLYVVNPKDPEVQGTPTFAKVEDVPPCDLAIMAIAARFIPASIEVLIKEKGTRAFIILSAGFSEESEEGRKLEQQIVALINSVDGSLIGPNCTGMLTPYHHSIFTLPIPKSGKGGCDFVTGSGATGCFIMDAGIRNGLTFTNVFSVGNSAQMGVEEVLAYLDETYVHGESAPVKLLYVENIRKPDLLLKHASSLIRKGARIAAIKAGSSEAGSRAASSHTGAMASPDVAVDTLFRKAGIVRCYGREDLVAVASIFMHPPLKGKNIAIITHAGGPAVMLTDALSNAGMQVPHIDGHDAEELLGKLFAGSSVSNPIDFLATGTAEQLGEIIDYCDQKFSNIDGMAVIFGTPGLFPLFDVYKLLDEKMKSAKKPVYPILPSLLTAKEEVEEFISKDRIIFPDEVVFGNALARVYQTPAPAPEKPETPEIDTKAIRGIVDAAKDGYISPAEIQQLLDAAGIPRAGEAVVNTADDASAAALKLGFPLVMKVVGPVHKSDVGGVVLNVKDVATVEKEFNRMITIPETTAILMQPMLSGMELFAGAKREPKFGHLVLCGMGGIFIEVLKDVSAGLVPLGTPDALMMIQRLKSYKMLEGVRGQEGVNPEKLAEVIVRLSALLETAPEISEMDLNPLLGKGDKIIAVDARIRIQK